MIPGTVSSAGLMVSSRRVCVADCGNWNVRWHEAGKTACRRWEKWQVGVLVVCAKWVNDRGHASRCGLHARREVPAELQAD